MFYFLRDSIKEWQLFHYSNIIIQLDTTLSRTHNHGSLVHVERTTFQTIPNACFVTANHNVVIRYEQNVPKKITTITPVNLDKKFVPPQTCSLISELYLTEHLLSGTFKRKVYILTFIRSKWTIEIIYCYWTTLARIFYINTICM